MNTELANKHRGKRKLKKEITLHEKPYFLFPNILKRWSSQKKWHWNMIFLVLSGNMIFLLPENMILFFRRKMKDDLSQKTTWKYDTFFKCSKKIVFPKKPHWNFIFIVLSGKMRAFFPKIWYFFFRRKMNDGLPQKIHGNMILSAYMYKCYKYDITLLP